ncbi:MAG: RICIN domain-containing protein [Lachnospiraceae bacterium]|nr:RICIN domain-containing protein [Lachnospiraceae bacterium]
MKRNRSIFIFCMLLLISCIIAVSKNEKLYAAGSQINTSDYSEIISATGYRLNVEGSRNNVMLNRVSVFYQDYTVGQQFKFTKSQHGYYLETKPVNGGSMAVNCNCMEAYDGCKVNLYNPTGSTTQAWIIVPINGSDNKFFLQSADKSNLYLTCDNRNDGNVYISSYTGGANQQWSSSLVTIQKEEIAYDKKITLYTNGLPVKIYTSESPASIKSSNKKVVKVVSGKLQPVKKGTATITVKFASGTSQKIKVTVKSTVETPTDISKDFYAVQNDVSVRSYASSSSYVLKTLRKNEKVFVKYSFTNSAGNTWYLLDDGSYIYSANLSLTSAENELKNVKGVWQQYWYSSKENRSGGLCTIVSCFAMLKRRSILDHGSTALSFGDVNAVNYGSRNVLFVKDGKNYWETNGGLYPERSYWVEGYTYKTKRNEDANQIHNKKFYIDLLEKKPEGVCIQVNYSGGQHCILLSDYDEAEDMFYVYDGVVSDDRRKITESILYSDRGGLDGILNSIAWMQYIE